MFRNEIEIQFKILLTCGTLVTQPIEIGETLNQIDGRSKWVSTVIAMTEVETFWLI